MPYSQSGVPYVSPSLVANSPNSGVSCCGVACRATRMLDEQVAQLPEVVHQPSAAKKAAWIAESI
jgi:hypothetical protein